MENSYSFTKNIKDKENKILNYYKRINNVVQPKIFAVPKRKKGTKKNIAKDAKDAKDEKDRKDAKDEKDGKDDIDSKKLTKKRIVIMDD